jgi:predicted nucleic-acid-binding Zn-ribbon protein
MKSGVCPKCGSTEVYSGAHISNKRGGYYANTIPLGGYWAQGVALDNYVCVNCGYVESYISDEKALREIAQKWPRVGEAKRKRDEDF